MLMAFYPWSGWDSTHTHTHTHTHTQPFSGPLSGTTQVSRHQKGKTNLDFTEARDSEWQWHQLGHMQVCTLLQTDNHVSTPPLKFFYRPDALPAAQPTVWKHWRLLGEIVPQKYSFTHFLSMWLLYNTCNWLSAFLTVSIASFLHRCQAW